MKTKYYWIALLFFSLSSGYVISQTLDEIMDEYAGVFMTYKDFRHGRPSWQVPAHCDRHSIWPVGFFKHGDVEILAPDTSIIFPADQIWGYTDHRKRLVRVFGKHHFQVVSDTRFVLYRKYSPTGFGHYFSRDLNAPIHKLNKKNLLREFSDCPACCEILRQVDPKSYLVWDERNGEYLINKLLLKCLAE